MTRIAGIGVGLFILAIIWVICLFSCLALSRAQGGLANAGIGAVLLAVILTLILWFFPREGTDVVQDYVLYDHYGIGRTILISILGIFLFIGLLAIVVFHVFEPLRTDRLKKLKTL